MYKPSEMSHTVVDQKEIAYRIEGSGPCLVLVHGFPQDHRVWDSFVKELTSAYQLVLIDLPGFGQSEILSEKHSMEQMAQAVYAVLEAENIKRCVLVGHSMGGYMGLAFAGMYPQMLAGLVLFHSHAAADSQANKLVRNQTIETVRADKDSFVTHFIADLFDPDFASTHPQSVAEVQQIAAYQTENAVVAALAGMRDRKDYIEELEKLSFPVLFIGGQSDTRIPVTTMMQQATHARHAEMLILADVGHMGFIEKPTVCGQTIAAFANKCFYWCQQLP